MANLKEWIEAEAEGETIEAVVLGEMGWGEYGSDDVPYYNECPKGQVLSWEDAKKFLDYDFDSGHGAPGCQAIYAWTKNKIIFICQYDGSTWPESIPRNPSNVMPEMPGG